MEVKTFLSTFSEGKEFTEYLAEFYNLEIPSPESPETLNYPPVSSYTRDPETLDDDDDDDRYLAHIMILMHQS